MRNAIKLVGLVMVLVLSACDGEADPELGLFMGTWRANSGVMRRACPGAVVKREAIAGEVSWGLGVSSDLASAANVVTPCRIKADVSDATAVGTADHECTRSDGAGGTVTVMVDHYRFAISPDGRSATETASGHVLHVAGGVSADCSFEAEASYQKVVAD